MNQKPQTFTPEQERIIREIQRIARKLGVGSLASSEFDEHHELGGVSTAGYQFGSWNEAVSAAGLVPYGPAGKETDNSMTRSF